MKPRSTAPKRKQISPVMGIVAIVVVLVLASVIGFSVLRDKPKAAEGPPQMSTEMRKQRQTESLAWKKELEQAEKEHRLPDYSKLPRAGHMGVPAPASGGGQPAAGQ